MDGEGALLLDTAAGRAASSPASCWPARPERRRACCSR
jgi:hypothetical protein